MKTKKSHDPKRQGEWAEACFTVKALTKGLIVSKPYGDSSRYDFLVDAAGKVSRVQVKSVRSPERNAYHVSLAMGSTKRRYSSGDFNYVAVLVIPHDVWYIIPATAIGGRKSLRFCPHRKSSRQWERYREAWEWMQ